MGDNRVHYVRFEILEQYRRAYFIEFAEEVGRGDLLADEWDNWTVNEIRIIEPNGLGDRKAFMRMNSRFGSAPLLEGAVRFSDDYIIFEEWGLERHVFCYSGVDDLSRDAYTEREINKLARECDS